MFDVLPQQRKDEVRKAPFDFPSENELRNQTASTTKLYLRKCDAKVSSGSALSLLHCRTAATDSGFQFASVTKDYNPIHLYVKNVLPFNQLRNLTAASLLLSGIH
eukprot:gb/GECG01015550.1/.p1 GENE.gb/GECG01015550.1/~~gb/GECG01015550.1/.p1  ORF type:complete len:105 (+),score=10.28 gb/GECG01015550.1/:1-315(+)